MRDLDQGRRGLNLRRLQVRLFCMRWRAALLVGIVSAVAAVVVAAPGAERLTQLTYVFRQDRATLTLTLPAPADRAPRALACAKALHDPLVLIRAVADNRAGRARFDLPDVIAVGLSSGRSLEFVGLDEKITADRWGAKASRLAGDLYERCAVALWNELSVARVVLPGARNIYLYAASARSIRLPNVRYMIVSDPITIGPDPVVLRRR
jgi:hypothetical protein